ncbi:hypothetical protein E4T39_01272, partial [Aureobasidium subglaciale]
ISYKKTDRLVHAPCFSAISNVILDLSLEIVAELVCLNQFCMLVFNQYSTFKIELNRSESVAAGSHVQPDNSNTFLLWLRLAAIKPHCFRAHRRSLDFSLVYLRESAASFQVALSNTRRIQHRTTTLPSRWQAKVIQVAARERRATPTMHNISELRLPLGTQADRLLLRSSKPKQAFNHINVIRAEDIESGRIEQPDHKPYVSSTPGPSPRSSSRSLISSETSKMSVLDSGSEDQQRLAEMATARLERQSRRIIDNYPTIPISKIVTPKTARNHASQQYWPTFDHPESSDGDSASMSLPSRTGTRQRSRRESPLDVHAKVFLPSSRESSLSRSHEVPRQDSMQLGLDDGDFQLVTSKKTKPSSRYAVGLDAHEVKMDDKPPTIAAPFDRHEINEVFGNDLPPLTYFQSNVGHEDGQVGFAMHPNGDISAQQWSQNDYQWYNIGQFSNVRRRTEGTLAVHRLNGENESHCLLQHTLCYFRAVSKQHEASIMNLPFGLKELQAAMPKVPINRPSRRVALAASIVETQIQSEAPARPSEKKRQTEKSSLAPDCQPWVPSYATCILSNNKLPISPDALSSTSFPFQHDLLSSAVDENTTSIGAYDNSSHRLTALNNLSFGTFSSSGNTDSAGDAFQFPTFEQFASEYSNINEHSGYLNTFLPKSAPQTIESQLYSTIPTSDFPIFLEKVQPQVASSDRSTAPMPRNLSKASLDKIFDTATARNAPTITGTRTVLHDPLQIQPPQIAHTAPSAPMMPSYYSRMNHADPLWWSIPIGDTPAGYIRQASSHTSNDDDDEIFDPLDSVPDYTPQSRTMETIAIDLPYMTTEELAIYSRPSTQNFNGPFFMGSPDDPNGASRKSHDQELNDWFFGGLKTVERQDEHFQYIKAAHNQASVGAHKPRSGPTGAPSFSTNNGKRQEHIGTSSYPTMNGKRQEPIGTPFVPSVNGTRQESEPFNEVTTRLLMSTHESLSQYTQGPIEQRRGYLAPFGNPPEWCVDKSASGNNSFFSEDWGQPPERISRDSRYRPLPSESNACAYDGHRGAGVGRTHPASNGRSRYNSSLK